MWVYRHVRLYAYNLFHRRTGNHVVLDCMLAFDYPNINSKSLHYIQLR